MACEPTASTFVLQVLTSNASIRAMLPGMAKHYGQYCPVAHALELVGERWSLLVVRELGAQSATRISPAPCPASARTSSRAGCATWRRPASSRKRKLPPPAAASVYELTGVRRGAARAALRARALGREVTRPTDRRRLACARLAGERRPRDLPRLGGAGEGRLARSEPARTRSLPSASTTATRRGSRAVRRRQPLSRPIPPRFCLASHEASVDESISRAPSRSPAAGRRQALLAVQLRRPPVTRGRARLESRSTYRPRPALAVLGERLAERGAGARSCPPARRPEARRSRRRRRRGSPARPQLLHAIS